MFAVCRSTGLWFDTRLTTLAAGGTQPPVDDGQSDTRFGALLEHPASGGLNRAWFAAIAFHSPMIQGE